MAKRAATRATVADSSYFTRLGMEVELKRLEEKAAQIRAWLGTEPARARTAGQELTGRGNGAATSRGGKRKRTMSAEARRRISAAQKARWAKQRGQAGAARTSAAPAPAARAKRGQLASATPAPRSRAMKARHEM